MNFGKNSLSDTYIVVSSPPPQAPADRVTQTTTLVVWTICVTLWHIRGLAWLTLFAVKAGFDAMTMLLHPGVCGLSRLPHTRVPEWKTRGAQLFSLLIEELFKLCLSRWTLCAQPVRHRQHLCPLKKLRQRPLLDGPCSCDAGAGFFGD